MIRYYIYKWSEEGKRFVFIKKDENGKMRTTPNQKELTYFRDDEAIRIRNGLNKDRMNKIRLWLIGEKVLDDAKLANKTRHINAKKKKQETKELNIKKMMEKKNVKIKINKDKV